MMNKEMLEDILYNNPLALLAIKDKQVIQQFNELIPYSTSFEIECDMVGNPTYQDTYIVLAHNEVFNSIPDIISVSNDTGEQRYRIPNGIKGIICVYNISVQLKIHSLLNPLSGIHYHVDCTECYNEICSLIRRKSNTNYILSELDTWLFEGETVESGSRELGQWFKLNDLKTVEFRMGEMTFEYRKLIERIIHCNSMVKKFKDEMEVARPTFEELDSVKILNYLKTINVNKTVHTQNLNFLKSKLTQITTKKEPDTTDVILREAPPTIRSRTHIFKPSNH